MIDLWLKAFHVAAAMAFVGGMLAVSLALPGFGLATPPSPPAVAALRRWDRMVTTPAMLLAWTAGLAMAIRGGWFASAWLPAKLVLVVALSGLHGVQSGTLRRLAGADATRTGMRLAGPSIVGLAAVIVVLVVIKPF